MPVETLFLNLHDAIFRREGRGKGRRVWSNRNKLIFDANRGRPSSSLVVAGKRGELIKERGRGVVCSFRIELGFAIEWKRLSLLISLVRIPIFLFLFPFKSD